MFYGAVVKPNMEVCPTPADGGEILHLSQACLSSAGDETCYLMVENENKKKFAICSLNPKINPNANLDIFLHTRTSNVKLSMKGKGEIHVVGYFEPEDSLGQGEEADSDEGESELEDAKQNGAEVEDDDDASELDLVGKTKTRNLKGGKPAMALAKPALNINKGRNNDSQEVTADEESGSEEESDAEVESDNDDEDVLDVSDEESEEEEENPMFKQLKQKLQAKKLTPPPKKSLGGQQGTPVENKQQNKRKLEETKQKNKQKEHQDKKAKGSGTSDGDTAKFEKELETYLKAHGRTPLASLGTHVKRPPGVDKLGQFMKEKPQFAVENGFVSLVK